MKRILALFLLCFTAALHAAPGDLDSLNSAVVGLRINATAVQTDGKIIIAGNFTTVGGTARSNIARLNANGTLDTGFNPRTNGDVNTVAVQADGKILLGGDFTTVQGTGEASSTTRSRVARVNADGTLDTGFNPNANSTVHSIAVKTGGKILLGGAFTGVSATTRFFVAQLNADGTLDSNFQHSPNNTVRCVVVQADGKILIGGEFEYVQLNASPYTYTFRSRVVRLNADGTLDTGFDPNVNHFVTSMAVQADNKIVIGGIFTQVSATTRNRVARVNSDGTLDTAFDPNLGPADREVQSVVVQADGKILLGGLFTTLQPNGAASATTRNRVARVNSDGTLDTAFDPNPDSTVNSVAVQADGKILLGGRFTSLQPNGAGSSTNRNLFARLLNDAPVAAPTVTAISPATGSTAGGTSVTLTGTNLTGATGVTIGGAAATSVVVTDDTTITAVTPAGSAGTASVLVTTPSGTNAANTLYTYVLPSLVSWYRGEGNANDSMGANPGTAQGGVTYAAGKSGQAFNLDGGGGTAVICGNNASLQLSNGTVSAWIKTSNAGSSYRAIMVKQLAYGLFMKDNILMAYDWSAGVERSTGVGVGLIDNQWHHVAFTFQAGVSNGSKIYIDGALSTSFTWNVSSQGENLAVGSGFGNGSTQNFTGLIDEAQVYNTALSATDIQNIFAAGGNIVAPTVASPTSTALAATTATLGGNVSSDGGAAVTARGVVYSLTATNNNPQIGGPGVTVLAGTGTTGVFTVNATGLTANSGYSYAAYATNSGGTSYSSVGTFATTTTFDTPGASPLTYSGVISGAVGVTKTGTAVLTLTGANDYTGTTTVSAGALNIQNNTALGTIAGGTSVTAGAALQMQNNITTSAEPLTLNGTGVSADGALRNISGNNNFTGPVTLQSATRINSDAGTLTLSNASEITGAGLGLTVGGASNTTIASIIGTGSGTLTKDGGGTLTLSGSAANTATGTTAVSGGTLIAGKTAAVAIAGDVTVGDGSGVDVLQLSGTGSNQIANTSILTFNGTTTNAGTFRLNAQSETVGGLVSTSGAGIVENNTSGTSTLTLDVNTTNRNFSGILQNGGAGILALTKTGTATQTLAGGAANTYTGTTAVNGGTLIAGKTAAVAIAGDVTVGDGTGVDILQLSGSGNDQIANTSILTFNGTTTNAGTFRLNALSETIGGLVSTGGAGIVENNTSGTSTLTLDVNTTNRSFNGILQNGTAGTLALTKTGTATQTLAGTNTYTGATTVSAGILNIQNATGLGTTAGGTTVSNGATLQLQGGITVGAELLSLNGGAASGQTGALVNVSGTNTYGGAVTVATSSSISAAGGSVLNLTGGVVKNGTVATFNGGGTINVGTVGISGASANSDLVVDGATVNLNVANTYNGPTFIRNSGTLNANVVDALPAGPRTALTFDGTGTSVLTLGAAQSVASLTAAIPATITLNANTITVGDAASNTTFAGSIGGTGGLTKDGASTQILTGTNTYSGATTVGAGTLTLNNVAGYKTTALSVASGATLSILMPGHATSSWDAISTPANVAFNSVSAAITGAGRVTLGTSSGTHVVAGGGSGVMTTNMSTGGVLDVQSGQWQWGFGHGSAATNNGSLNIASGAAYRNSDGAFQFDALTGSGTIGNAFGGAVTLTLGVQGTTNNATYGVSSNTATFSGVIASGESYNNVTTAVLNLVKSGSGTQILSGANTYSGTTTVSAGTLSITGNINSSATIAVNGGLLSTSGADKLANAAAVTVGGGTLTLGGNDTVTSLTLTSGTIGGTATLTANTYGLQGGFVNGNLGAGVLTKSTGGSVTLNGTAGATAVNVTAGTLTLGSSNRLDDGATVTVSGGTLTQAGPSTDTVATFNLSSGSFDGSGTLTATSSYELSGGTVFGNLGTGTINSSGTVTLNGSTAATTVNITAGTLTYGSSDRLANGATVTVSGTGILNVGTFTDTVTTFNMSAGSLNGTGTLTATTAYTLSGGTVTANLGTGTINSSGTVALNGTAGATVVNVTAGTLTLGSTDRLADGATVTVSGGTLTQAGSSTDTVATFNLSSGSFDGSGTLTATSSYELSGGTVFGNLGTGTINSTGTVTLNGSTAATVVNVTAGTLTYGSSNRLADGATVTVSGTGILNVGTFTDTVTAFNMSAGSLNGTGTLTATTAYTLSGGTVTANLGTGTINSSGTVALNGTAGATAVNVTAGTLTLGSSNRLDDGATVTVSGGTLTQAGPSTDTVATFNLSSGSFDGSGTLTATSSYELSGGTVFGNLGTGTINSSGTVALNGSTAATVVNVTAGALTLGIDDRLANGATVTVSGTGILNMGTRTDTVSIFNMSAGSLNGTGTLTAGTYGLSGGTVTANLGTGTINSSGTVALNGTAGALAVNVTAGTLTLGSSDRLADGATVTVSGGTLTQAGSSTDTVATFNLSSGSFDGSGTLTATSSYELSGGTVFGNLGTGTINSTGTVTLNGSTAATVVNVTAGTLTLGIDDRLANGATVTVSGTGILNMGTRTDTVSTFNMSAGSLNGTGTLTATTAYTLSGGTVTANLGTGTINSSGTVALNGTAGATTVNISAGTLTLGSADRLADGASVSITGGGTLALGTFDDTVGAVSLTSGSITGSGGVLTSASTYSVASGSVSAILGGSVGLTKTAPGTVTLSGANTYTGATTISQGTLALSGTGALADSSAVSVNGATGIFDISGISGAGETVGSLAGVVSSSVVLGDKNLTAGGDGTSTIFAGAISGTGSLTKAGTGTLTLNSANGYSGLTTVSAGILNIQNATGLGTTAAGTSVSNGATLQLQGGITVGAETLSLNGGAAAGQNGALVNVSGTNSFGGAITVATSSSISAAGGSVLNLTGGVDKTGTVLTLTGGGTINVSTLGISGASANSDLIVDGATVNLDVVNTYNGPTFIRNSGTLNANVVGALPTGPRSALTFDGTGTSVLTLGAAQSVASLTAASTATITLNANTITVGDAASNTTFAGAIGGTGGLTKDGASTQVLSASNGYSGTTTVSDGTLSITGSINSSATIAVNGGLLSTSGVNKLSNTAAVTVSGGTLTIGGNDDVGSLVLTSGTIGGSATLTAATYGLESGTVTGNLGAGTLTKSTVGTVALNGTAGATVVNVTAGALTLGASSALNSATTVAISGGSLNLGANNQIGNAAVTLTGGGTLDIGGFSDTVGAVTLTSGSITGSGGVLTGSSYDVRSGSVSAILGGSGIALTKTTAGTVTLSGANTYTGATTISAGTLTLSGSGALSDSSAVNVNGATGIFDISGISAAGETIGSLAGVASSSVVLGGKNLTAGGDGTSTIFTGGFSGADGSLTKAGTGTLTLNGASTYTGLTTVSAGILNLQNATGLGTTAGATTVSNGATLQLQGGITVGAEALSLNGGAASGQSGALVNVSGTNTYGGAVTVAASSSISAAGGSVLNLTGGVDKTGTVLTFNGGGTINVSTLGIIGASANSDLVVNGVTVNMEVANTYNGPTFIRNSGTLNANVTNALPTANGRTAVTFDGTGTSVLTLGADQSVASLTSAGAATLTLNSSTLTVGAASGSTSFAGLITGTGGLIKDGNSTQILANSASTFSGNVALQGGILRVSAGHGDNNNTSAIGLPTFAGRTITVSSGANLQFAADNVLGGSNVTPTASIIVNGGTFENTGNFFSRIGALTLNGGTLNAVGGNSTGFGSWGFGSTVTVGGSAASTISASGTNSFINLNATTTFSVADATGDANTDLLVAAVLADQTASQSGAAASLVKSGAGTMTLSGANTYSGTTTVSAGTLSITGDINNSATLSISGGLLSTSGANKLANTAAVTVGGGTLTIGGDDGVGSLILTSGTIGGSATLTANTYGLQGGFVNGNLGAGILTKSTGGSVTLNGTAAAATVNITGGTLTLGSAERLADTAAVTVNGGALAIGAFNEAVGSVQLTTGSITGTTGVLTSGATYDMRSGSVSAILGGSVGLTKTTGGTVTLSGANTYTGTTTVSDGTLSITGSINSSATLAINGGGELTTSGVDKLADAAAVTVSGGTLTIGGDDTVTSLTLTSGTIGGSATLTANTYGLQGGFVNGNLGAGVLTKSTGGSVTLTGAAGAATVNITGGTLSLGANDRLDNGAAVNLTTGGTLAIGGFSDTVGSVTLTSGSITGSGGTLTSTSTYDVRSGSVSAILGGSVGLTKTTGSTVTLTGSNTYTGTTTVSAGTLALSGAGRLSDSSSLVVNGGTFDIGSVSDTVAGVQLASGSITGTSGVLTSTSTFDVRDGSVSAILGGSVGLTKTTAGTVTLSGINTYTGATLLSNGDLVVDGSIGSSSLTTIDGGTLRGTGTVGAIQLNSGGAINPAGISTAGTLNTGNIAIVDGQLRFNLGGTGAGQYDQLNTTGTINLAAGGTGAKLVLDAIGTLVTTLANDALSGYTTTNALNNAFTLAINDVSDAIIGKFAKGTFGSTNTKVVTISGLDYVEGLLGSGYYGRINYAGDSGTPATLATAGNDIVLKIVTPEITVTEGATTLSDNGGYNFGDVDKVVPAVPLTKTFTIKNDGEVDLMNIAITPITGAAMADYILNTTGTATNLIPGASTTFTVTFDPQRIGTRNAYFSITSNDLNEATFDIPLTGVGSIARDVLDAWTIVYGGVDAPVKTRSGSANAVAVQKRADRDEALAVFATGHTTNAAGNTDIYTARYEPLTGVRQWEVIFNGAANGTDDGYAIAVDGNGDVVITGYTENGFGNADVYVAKYAGADGTLLWQKIYGGPGQKADVGTSIAVDAANNIAVGGYGENIGTDFFAARYASNGTPYFERLIDGGSYFYADRANAVAVDAAGNLAVAGYSRNATNSHKDFRVMKLDAITGATLWQYNANGSSSTDEEAYDVGFNSAGQLFATGTLRSSNFDLYTVKLDVGGGLLWQKQWNSSFDSSDAGLDLAVDTNGDVVVGGASYRAPSVQDGYVVKYRGTDGSIAWDRRFNETAGLQDVIAAVDLDALNNVVATGYSQNADLTYDVLTAKMFASDGGLVWSQRYNGGANKNDSAGAVAVSPDGNVYVAGYSTAASDTTDFLVKNYQAIVPVAQAPQAITFNNPGAQNAGTSLKLSATASSGLTVSFTVLSGPASIDEQDNTLLKFSGTGTVEVRASQRGNSVTAAAPNVNQSFMVNKSNQTISFSLPSSVPYTSNTVVLGAATTSGLPVTYGLVSGPGVINGNVLSFSGPGPVEISADQAGDARFNAAVQVTSTVIANNTAPVIIPNNVAEGWFRTYPGSGATEGRAVALQIVAGSSIASFVAGSATNGAGNKDIYLMKFDNNGGAAWGAPVIIDGAGNGNDEALAAAVDTVGDVYISGYTTVSAGNTDVYVAKFNGASGAPIWTKPFSGTAGGADSAVSLVLQGADVVIGGSLTNTGTGVDFFGAKLNQSDGNGGWNVSVNAGGTDYANAVAVGSEGNVALAGYASNDAYTVQLASGTGATNWSRRYNAASKADAVRDVAIDTNNDVIITAYSQAANYNIYTAKYSRLDGSIVWEQTYNSSFNSSDAPYGLAIDPNGNIIVAGTSYRAASQPDSITLKYNGASGTQVGEHRYNGPANKADEHFDVSVDVNGNPVVTGYSTNSDSTFDIYTAKLDGSNLANPPLWEQRFNGAANKSDAGRAVAADPTGRAWVAGYQSNASSVTELLLLKYQPIGAPPPPPPAGDGEFLAFAPPPPVGLQMFMEVEQGDTARFAAGYYDAEGNDTVEFSAVMDGAPMGTIQVDPQSGNFAWEGSTSSIAPGPHEVIITATDTAEASAQVTLQINITSNLADRAWRYANFGSTDAAGNAADDADPDGDGVSNLAEFAFGLNPTQGSSDVGIRAEAAGQQPQDGGMRAVFKRRKDRATVGIDYVVEFSSNLIDWTPSAAIPEVLADEGILEKVGLPFPILPNGQQGRFFRIQLLQPITPAE